MTTSHTDVFISYAGADKEFTLRLANELKESDLEVRLLDHFAVPGDDYANAMEEAIRSAKVILVVISKNWTSSTWVRTETALALTQGAKRVVPILAEKGAEVPFMLRSFSGIDLSDNSSYSTSVKELATRLKNFTFPSEAEGYDTLSRRIRHVKLERLELEEAEFGFETEVRLKRHRVFAWQVSMVLSLAVILLLVLLGYLFFDLYYFHFAGVLLRQTSPEPAVSWAIAALIGLGVGVFVALLNWHFFGKLFKSSIRKLDTDVWADR